MDYTNSLNEFSLIARMLYDIHRMHGAVFSTRSLELTVDKVRKRFMKEGMSFLTIALPRLGKALDKALSEQEPLDASILGFKPQDGSKLPKFLGELFNCVLNTDGLPLQDPCTNIVASLRDVLYLFYKYELPYDKEKQQAVIDKFIRTEDELRSFAPKLTRVWQCVDDSNCRIRSFKAIGPPDKETFQEEKATEIAREAKKALARLFCNFDPKDIYPRHGPGAVATRQRLWNKYLWSNVSKSITDVYPFTEYFCASYGHICDTYKTLGSLSEESMPARVVLVPKDSRGPRLISCEPVDNQWVQQGLGKAIVDYVEKHALTQDTVFFTDQEPNRLAAKFSSIDGRYATLDLNEASDRVSLDLVLHLFPEHLVECLVACRSSSTELPDGRVLELDKYAPMGSALCFPVLALSVWAILYGRFPDKYVREHIHVYGDDVIVPTCVAREAIEALELFGLKVNKDKSCISGFFRESCGMDAYKGVCVTPIRLRTVWSSSRSPHVYLSWIAYANSFYDKQYYTVYNYIVDELVRIYGPIPDESLHIDAPCLRSLPEYQDQILRRTNSNWQKCQYKVWDLKTRPIRHSLPGWSRLLRHFAEVANDRNRLTNHDGTLQKRLNAVESEQPFCSDLYTERDEVKLRKRWR